MPVWIKIKNQKDNLHQKNKNNQRKLNQKLKILMKRKICIQKKNKKLKEPAQDKNLKKILQMINNYNNK